MSGEWAEVPVGETWAKVDRPDLELVTPYRWHLDSKGYARYDTGQEILRMHRLILGLAQDDPRKADHRNRDKLDNRRDNLRIATPAQNGANRGKFNGRFSSLYKGVTFISRDQRWRASIRIDGKLYRLGDFKDEVLAARAYDQAALEVWGPFAHLNYADA
jgi:hypothetical protein